MTLIDDPATWPLGLCLPVIRRVPDEIFPQCDLLRPGYGPVVYLLLVSEASSAALSSCETAHYRDFAELTADG